MSTLTGIKLDDGSGGFASQCFPVRNVLRTNVDNANLGGAWLLSQKVEQRRRFKAVLCSKPRTFEEIREDRKQAVKDGTTIAEIQERNALLTDDEDDKLLDGFFLMRHCCVEDPADLCSVNISGQQLSRVKEQDLSHFDNVAYVSASENYLYLESFKNFPIVREIELSLNGIRNINITEKDFKALENDVVGLGLLSNLKVLHLTGNELRALPVDMARPFQDSRGARQPRFAKLEVLMVDDNKLYNVNDFATLAGFRKLRHLNMSKNAYRAVPQLLLREGRHVTEDTDTRPSAVSARRARREKRARKKARRETREAKHVTPVTSETTIDSKLVQASTVSDDIALIMEGSDSKPPQPTPADSAQHEEETTVVTSDTDAGTVEGVPSDLDALLAPLQPVEEDDEDFSTELTGHTDTSARDVTEPSVHDVTAPATPPRESHPPPPPFPELLHLDLSFNQICDEESLLALGAWPRLARLMMHDNPLTTETSGDPPLLTSFLRDRLNINLVRKRPGPLVKPHVEVPLNPERVVSSYIPPVPRCDPDQLLALVHAAAPPAVEHASRDEEVDETAELLDAQAQLTDRTAPPPESADNFFMTQVAGEAAASPQPEPVTPVPTPPAAPRPAHQSTSARRRYSALFNDDPDVTEDDDQPLPTDIHGSVRALQYALNHPLVFKENRVTLDEIRPFDPPLKAKDPRRPPHRSRRQQVEKVYERLRTRTTITDQPLADVLEGSSNRNKQDASEAKKLLSQVQRRYNAARAQPGPARSAGNPPPPPS